MMRKAKFNDTRSANPCPGQAHDWQQVGIPIAELDQRYVLQLRSGMPVDGVAWRCRACGTSQVRPPASERP